MKPTPYFVEYQDAALLAAEIERVGAIEHSDIARTLAYRDFDTLAKARGWVAGCHAAGYTAQVVERYNIRDVTPRCDGRGILWDFDTRVID